MTDRMAFSVDEVGALLGVSIPTVYARINDGSLRSVKFGRRRLILRADIEALFERAGDMERDMGKIDKNKNK